MTFSLLLWDYKNDPPSTSREVMNWQSYIEKNKIFSVPCYVETHAKRLRSNYLAFIHDLGETKIGGKRIIDHLDVGDGFSFWWMTSLAEKSPFKSPRIYDCLRLLALEEILLKRKPAELVFHSPDRDLAKSIQQLCYNLHINFVWQRSKELKKKWSLREIYRGLPHSIQGLISLARFLVLKWPLRRLQRQHWFAGENTFFLCSYFIHLDPESCAEGKFYSRQWGVLSHFFSDNGKNTNWMHHFLFSPVVPNVRKGLTWLDLFNSNPNNQANHSFIETYLSWKVVCNILKNWCWLNRVSWHLKKNQSTIWFWPIIRHDWCSSLRGQVAMNNCLWVALFDAAFKEMPFQKVGFYLYENQGWEQALLRAWRHYNHGEIIAVQHATVPFWHLYYFDDPRFSSSQQGCSKLLPNRLAVNGNAAQKAFIEGNCPIEQVVDVEALRYLNLSRISQKTVANSSSIKILILGDMLPEAMHDLLKLLEEVAQFLPENYRFTLKSHPGYVINLADYPKLKIDETTEALDKILDQYSVAIAANSTSASVDAYLAGLHVIISFAKGSLNLSPLRGYAGVSFVKTSGELINALTVSHEVTSRKNERNEFFFLDAELPRWKQLLSSTSSTEGVDV